MKRGASTLLVGAGRRSGADRAGARRDVLVARARRRCRRVHQQQPAGGRWKVLFKTGPGKAAALRGSTDIVPARDTSPVRYSRFDRDILDGQAFYGIPEPFIRAIIKTESDFDPRVVSSAGAKGLMQLMPGTARLMGVTDIFDPRQNIMGGTRYLQVLARRFCKTPAAGDSGCAPLTVCSPEEKVKVIAGYHAGRRRSRSTAACRPTRPRTRTSRWCCAATTSIGWRQEPSTDR